MWDKMLGLNSFIFWPITIIFLVYAAGRAVLTLEWKMLVVAFVVFCVFTIAEVVLGIMAE